MKIPVFQNVTYIRFILTVLSKVFFTDVLACF